MVHLVPCNKNHIQEYQNLKLSISISQHMEKVLIEQNNSQAAKCETMSLIYF